MEIENSFKNSEDLWKEYEDEQLNKLYNIDFLDIIDISKILNRTPGQIISRLHKYNYISNRTSARGYINYKNSDLYKSIVLSNKDKKTIIKSKNDNILLDINNTNRELQSDNISNIGKKWTDEEEEILLKELSTNIDIELIAQKHNRNIGGITSRIKKIAYKLYINNNSIDEIIIKTKLNELEIIEKQQNNSIISKEIT